MGTFCEVCEKNFSKSSNLRAHAKKFHPEKVSEIAPKKVYKTALAFCGECSKTFTKYANYKRHVAKFHKEKNVAEKQYRFKCVVCKKNFSHLRHFKSHKKTSTCNYDSSGSGFNEKMPFMCLCKVFKLPTYYSF